MQGTSCHSQRLLYVRLRYMYYLSSGYDKFYQEKLSKSMRARVCDLLTGILREERKKEYLNGQRRGGCGIATDDMPLLINKELCEVPFYSRTQKS